MNGFLDVVWSLGVGLHFRLLYTTIVHNFPTSPSYSSSLLLLLLPLLPLLHPLLLPLFSRNSVKNPQSSPMSRFFTSAHKGKGTVKLENTNVAYIVVHILPITPSTSSLLLSPLPPFSPTPFLPYPLSPLPTHFQRWRGSLPQLTRTKER